MGGRLSVPEVGGGADFNRLIEEKSVAHILAFTSPRDVCRLSAVCLHFRAAAESEIPWERFLPSDWWQLLPRSVSALHFTSKHDLFFRLSKPILIDDGTKCMWLEKASGKKCWLVSPRDLIISWGDDTRYWRWNWRWNPAPPDSSVFPEVAELIGVWWFDIFGTIDMADLSPNTMYAVHFLIRHTPEHSRWELSPIVLSLELEDDTRIHEQSVSLCPRKRGNALRPSMEFEGWMYVTVGEFLCDADGGKIAFRMQEVKQYKKGLIAMGAEIRPCSDEERREQKPKRRQQWRRG